MPSIELNNWRQHRDVVAIVAATFPQYRRKKVWIRAAETVTLSDLNWSGGTRSEYRSCTLPGVTGKAQVGGSMDRYHQRAPWDNPAEGQTVPIPQGMVVVRGGHFCGKESMLTLHVHPADMPKYLPAA